MGDRKVFCTLAFGNHAELLEIGRPAIETYCERHGYDLVVRTQQRTDLPASWEKIPLVRELLDDYPEVMWMDADAVIVDPSEDIFAALSPDRSIGIVMHVNLSLLPNAGVLAFRSSPEAIALLDQVWATRERYRDHGWWEQAALCEALGFETIGGLVRLTSPTRYMPALQFLPVVWNSIAIEYSPRAKIKHYPATEHERRVRWMSRDVRIAAAHGRPRGSDLSAVFLLHGSDPAQLDQFLSALDSVGDKPVLQTVLVAPTDRAFDRVAALARPATVLRNDAPPDEALLDALAEVDGRILLLVDGAVPITQELCNAIVQFADANPAALMRRTQAGELVAFHHQRLPVATWFTSAEEPRPPFSELQRAFAALGTAVVG